MSKLRKKLFAVRLALAVVLTVVNAAFLPFALFVDLCTLFRAVLRQKSDKEILRTRWQIVSTCGTIKTRWAYTCTGMAETRRDQPKERKEMPDETELNINDLDEPTKEFLKEEQSQRRGEIEHYKTRIENDLRYGLVITGAIWAWLFMYRADAGTTKASVVAVIPTAAMLLLYLRWRAFDKAILQVADYTRKLERVLNVVRLGLGWETYLATKREEDDRRPYDIMTWHQQRTLAGGCSS